MTKAKWPWTLIRTLTFVAVGLLNTVFIRPEDVGSWKNYLGYLLLTIATIDIIYLIRKLRATKK